MAEAISAGDARRPDAAGDAAVLAQDFIPELSVVLPSGMPGLERLSRWVDEAGAVLALPPARAFALRLCTEELVGNVILHGQPGAGVDAVSIAIGLRREAAALRLRIEDDGAAFDPTAAAAPARPGSLEEAQVGGLGLVLVRRFATAWRYRRVGGRNRIDLLLAA